MIACGYGWVNDWERERERLSEMGEMGGWVKWVKWVAGWLGGWVTG